MPGLNLFPFLGILGLSVMGCASGGSGASGASGGDAVVRGTVTYRERVALPPGAVIRVTLSDVSLTDVPATVVAETTITAGGKQVPFPFELKYDPAAIRPRNSYAVRATILTDDSLAWTTDTMYPVITRESPTRVDLLLKRVATPPAGTDGTGAGKTDGGASGSLVGTSWRLEDLLGRGVVDGAEATLEFAEEGRVAGRGSCNRFSGSVEVSARSIKFGRLGSTMMACPDAIMKQERDYLQALELAERYELKGSVLNIYCKGATKPLRFAQKAD